MPVRSLALLLWLVAASATAAPVADLCRHCSSSAECSTSLCVIDDSLRYTWCTQPCSGPSDCGADFDCVPFESIQVCKPKGAPPACVPLQCASDGDCAVGFGCNAQGMCEARGDVGTRCELTRYCKSCGVCTGTSQEAYCRACCGNVGAGGICTACGTTCGGGDTCNDVTNSGGADRVCVPTTAPGTCQSCSGSTPCRDGESCVAGRCHAACNPAHPATCGACAATSATTGVCACPDEVVQTDQGCAGAPGQNPICVNGSSCVGSPETCRQDCSLADAGSCPSGKTCTTVGSKPVCTGTTSSAASCQSTVGGACVTGSCEPGLTCSQGRCYDGCNPSAPGCAGCTAVSSTEAVCACSDQFVALGARCGVFDGGVGVCQSPGLCAGGLCRPGCDPNALPADRCAAPGSVCTHEAPGWVCEPAVDAGTTQGGGGGGGGTSSGGCGCSASGGALVPLLLAGLVARLGTRRRAA